MRGRDRGGIERDRARGGAVEAGEGGQERRLAAGGAADDGDDFSGGNLGGEARQRIDAVRIDFADPVECEHYLAPLCLPNASCQRSSGAKAISISQSVVLPRMAKM